MLEVVRFIGADRKVRKIAEGLAFSHRYPVEAPGGARAADRLRAMPMCPAPWPVVRDGADGLKDGADGMLFSAGG